MWTDPSLSTKNIQHFCCCLKMCLFAEHYRGAIGPEGFVQFRVNEIELAALPLRLLCHCQPRLNNKQVASNCFFLETWETFCVEAISECYYKLPLAMVSKYIFKIFDQTLMAKYISKFRNTFENVTINSLWHWACPNIFQNVTINFLWHWPCPNIF